MSGTADPAMTALEADLRSLGAVVAFPPTPELVTAVQARLEHGRREGYEREPGRGPTLVRPRKLARSLLLAAALVLLLAAAALGSYVILRGLAVIRVDVVPSASPTGMPTGSAGSGLDLGRQVQLADVAAAAGFAPLVPEGPLLDGVPLGPPDSTWVDTAGEAARATLVWTARRGLPVAEPTGVGLLVDELRGSTREILVTKLVGPATAVTPVALADGSPAYWITGGPHTVLYEAPQGGVREAEGRLASDTLVFNRGGLLVRIETAAGLATALAVADSLP